MGRAVEVAASAAFLAGSVFALTGGSLPGDGRGPVYGTTGYGLYPPDTGYVPTT